MSFKSVYYLRFNIVSRSHYYSKFSILFGTSSITLSEFKLFVQKLCHKWYPITKILTHHLKKKSKNRVEKENGVKIINQLLFCRFFNKVLFFN